MLIQDAVTVLCLNELTMKSDISRIVGARATCIHRQGDLVLYGDPASQAAQNDIVFDFCGRIVSGALVMVCVDSNDTAESLGDSITTDPDSWISGRKKQKRF